MLAEQCGENESDNIELTQVKGISLAVFQAFEAEKSDEYHKLEYINGRVYAMAGGSEIHNRLSGEMFNLFRNHLTKMTLGKRARRMAALP